MSSEIKDGKPEDLVSVNDGDVIREVTIDEPIVSMETKPSEAVAEYLLKHAIVPPEVISDIGRLEIR